MKVERELTNKVESVVGLSWCHLINYILISEYLVPCDNILYCCYFKKLLICFVTFLHVALIPSMLKEYIHVSFADFCR